MAGRCKTKFNLFNSRRGISTFSKNEVVSLYDTTSDYYPMTSTIEEDLWLLIRTITDAELHKRSLCLENFVR